MTYVAWPGWKELFIKLNTPLPASAAVERLFCCASSTMNHEHTCLSDSHFENLVFLKVNKWIEPQKQDSVNLTLKVLFRRTCSYFYLSKICKSTFT